MSDPARILVVQAASPRIAGAPDVAAEYRDIQRSIDAAPTAKPSVTASWQPSS